MIATLSGKIATVRVTSLILQVNGIGYELYSPASDVSSAKVGENKDYYIYEHIREDTHDLYGFSNELDKAMFEQLLSVSGVGPKVALAIVSSVENLSDVIRSGNTSALQTVSGVGKRVAERIIVDLRSKLGSSGESLSRAESNSPIFEALTQLGYHATQAHSVISKLPPSLQSDEERIKWALKELGK